MILRVLSRFPLLMICAQATIFGVVLLVLQACPAGSPAPDHSAEADPGRADESQAEIEHFLDGYFSTWSAGAVEQYAAHFHPAATIKFINGPEVQTYDLGQFIDMQTQLIAAAEQPLQEEMTSYELWVRDGMAWVGADWVLAQGATESRGVDHFILARDDSGAWKIISLVYYFSD